MTSQSNDRDSIAGPSPRKRKAHGMFANDDNKSIEVAISSDPKIIKQLVF